MTKEIIKETEYLKFYYEEEHSLLTAEWLSATEDMEDEKYRSEHRVIVEMVQKYKPKLGLSDNRSLFYTIDPDMQKQIDEEDVPVFIESGLQKLAVLARNAGQQFEDVEEIDFENMAVEQLTEEKNYSTVQIQIFGTEEEAREWLLN